MATHAEPEIILYDLACTKNVCFSPVVWRIRLMLNYKQIPYKTIFLEFPDIEPTLKGLGIPPHPSPSDTKYTVPTIHHLPTSTYLMDSPAIAQFLHTTYPTPHLPLSSPLGTQIETLARSTIASTFRTSITPREIRILPIPRSQAYFRAKIEGVFKCPIEDLLLSPDKEDEAWEKIDGEMREVGRLIRTNSSEGPFVLGAEPSGTDFFVAGAMQFARVVDEGVWRRFMKYDGFREIYEGCERWMEKKD